MDFVAILFQPILLGGDYHPKGISGHSRNVGNKHYPCNRRTHVLHALDLLAPSACGRLKQPGMCFAISAQGSSLVGRASKCFLNLFDQLLTCHQVVSSYLTSFKLNISKCAKAHRNQEAVQIFGVDENMFVGVTVERTP